MVSLCQPAEIEPVDTSAVSQPANEHVHIAVFPRFFGLFLPFFQDFDVGIIAGMWIEKAGGIPADQQSVCLPRNDVGQCRADRTMFRILPEFSDYLPEAYLCHVSSGVPVKWLM